MPAASSILGRNVENPVEDRVSDVDSLDFSPGPCAMVVLRTGNLSSLGIGNQVTNASQPALSVCHPQSTRLVISTVHYVLM